MTDTESSTQTGISISEKAPENGSGLKLLLICHGQGMQHRYADLGSVNSGLTAEGWEQVESLAKWLSTHESIRALYSDPLLQSRLTAQRIGQSVKLKVSMLRDLSPQSERAVPESQFSTDGVDAEADDTIEDRSPSNTEGNGGSRTFRIPALERIARDHPEGTVALVANANAIRLILRTLMDANDIGLEIGHTSVSGLHVSGDSFSIAYINRREHIPVPMLAPEEEQTRSVEVAELDQDIGSIVTIYNRVATDDVAQKAGDDRERIRDLLDFAKLPKDLNVLDAGTGLGVLATMLAEEGAQSVIGVDISPGMLEQAEYLRLSHPTDTTSNVSYRLAHVQMLPFRDERFDAVSCRLLLNHFKSPKHIIREIVRVLKPNGIFVMAELLSVDDPVKRATQNAIEERRNPSHVAARSAEQYDQMIMDAGLEIVDAATVSLERELNEWLEAYRTSSADSTTVIEMVEAGLETDAAGIGARKRGDRIEFVQRMYYLKAAKPAG